MQWLPLFIVLFGVFGCQSTPRGGQMVRECSIQKLKTGSTDFKVEYSLYASREASNKAIIIMPPTGGANYIDRSYAKGFCKQGFDVYLITHWTQDSENAYDLELHKRLFARGEQAIENIVALIPQGYIGLLGTSVGALHVAVATNLVERINAVFTIAGGAPIPGVIVESDQKAMRDLKKKRYETLKFKNDQEYLAALDKVFPLDPFKTPPLFKKKTLGMVISTIDTTVPAQYQIAQRDFWLPTTLFTLKSSHFFTIVKTWLWHQDDVTQFFVKSAQSHDMPL